MGVSELYDDDDVFEGIDISGPWGGIRIGAGGVRVGRNFDEDDDRELRSVRRRVRARLDFIRNLATYLIVVGVLAALDGLTGGGWWVQWVALIWGVLLLMQFMSRFAGPVLWGREAEERMVQQEMARRRGRVHVGQPPRPPEE